MSANYQTCYRREHRARKVMPAKFWKWELTWKWRRAVPLWFGDGSRRLRRFLPAVLALFTPGLTGLTGLLLGETSPDTSSGRLSDHICRAAAPPTWIAAQPAVKAAICRWLRHPVLHTHLEPGDIKHPSGGTLPTSGRKRAEVEHLHQIRDSQPIGKKVRKSVAAPDPRWPQSVVRPPDKEGA